MIKKYKLGAQQGQAPATNLFGGAAAQNSFMKPASTQNTSLFGAPTANQQPMGMTSNTSNTNLFGPAPAQNQSSLFSQPAQQQSVSFGAPSAQPQNSLFAKPQQTADTNLMQQTNQAPGGQIISYPPFAYGFNQTKILTLMPGNQTKYEKVNSLQSKELKELIKQVELNFENNRLYLNNLDSSIQTIQDNYKIIQSEAFNIAKFTKVINAKNTKLKFILQNFENEIKLQNEVLIKNRENCKILEHHPSMKISVPSDYLFNLVNEMEDCVKSHMQQISDLEALFTLSYQKEMGYLKMNSDVIEQIIVSLYESLIGITNETANLCEAVEKVKQIYYNFLRNNLGWKDYEIENKFRQSFSSQNKL